MRSYVVRRARVDDCEEIISLIRDFAVYEKAPPPALTLKDLREDSFGSKACQTVYVAEYLPSGDSGQADVSEGAGNREKELVGHTSGNGSDEGNNKGMPVVRRETDELGRPGLAR
ncbi:uncharacterized protein [Diadema antillarum]|uniref:uncharacterized protein isoform X2 n=1 Tax=Diadema antillarum TaxID=105358 RepID=UPI003A8BBF0F